jgi:predicted DNA-binding transcriptional regulator AlpA
VRIVDVTYCGAGLRYDDRMGESPWLDADAAADHLSLRIDAFYRAVRAGRLPKASHHLGTRTPRWDRSALDAVMIGGTASTDTRTAIDALAEEIKAEGRSGRSAQTA